MYFTSDLHLGHKKMLEVRPFNSIEDHDEHIIKQLKKINSNSEVWILGDVSCGKEDYALERLSEIDATLHLVSGNHDSVWPYHRNAHKSQRKFLEVFETVSSMARVQIGGKKVYLHHTHYGVKLPDNSTVAMLHGHTHSQVRITDYNIVNVAPEAWDYQVVSANDIEKEFSQSINNYMS